MALKTEKTDVSVETKPQPTAPPPATTVLELALYKIYTWGGVTYEGGKPYRFNNIDAMRLLAEQDMERPVWKIHQPAKPKQAPKNEIVDATRNRVTNPVDELVETIPATIPSPKRIDVGNDSEIADILAKTEDSGDVTV